MSTWRAAKAAHRKNGFGIKTLSDSAFQKLSSKPVFQRLMELYKFDKKSQRSYFFVVANFERKANAAAMKSDLRKGYKKSASGSFNIVDSLEHWAGKETLTEEDRIFID